MTKRRFPLPFILAGLLLAAAAPSAGAAQRQTPTTEEVAGRTARTERWLGELWTEYVQPLIAQHAGTKAAACVADFHPGTIDVTQTAILAFGEKTFRLPLRLLRVEFQALAGEAPIYFITGGPEAPDLPKLFAAQEAIFTDLRKALADRALRLDNPIRLVDVAKRMGMSPEKFDALDTLSVASEMASNVSDLLERNFEFDLLHEAGHAIDKCGELGAFTSASDPELRADDFALAMRAADKISVVFSLEALRTMAAFEGGGTADPTGARTACRLARAAARPDEGDAGFLPGPNPSGEEAARFRKRLSELQAFYRTRYPISLCDGFR